MNVTVMARDNSGAVVVGTMAGGGPGVVRLTHVTRALDLRKPWEQTSEAEPELLVDAETVEALC